MCALAWVLTTKPSTMESSIQELLLKERGGLGRKEEGKKGGRKGGKMGWGERERGDRSGGEGQFTIKEELQGLAPKNFD